MNKPWKVILVLIGIFAAGGVTGGLVTLRACREKFTHRPVPEEWAPKHLKKLSERLSLTPEQTEQVRPIIRRNMEQLNRLRSQSVAETRSVVEAMQREISEKLTPEQRVKFEELNRQMRERAKKLTPGKSNRPRNEEGRPEGERTPSPQSPPHEAGK